jgi:hypothetical protein
MSLHATNRRIDRVLHRRDEALAAIEKRKAEAIAEIEEREERRKAAKVAAEDSAPRPFLVPAWLLYSDSEEEADVLPPPPGHADASNVATDANTNVATDASADVAADATNATDASADASTVVASASTNIVPDLHTMLARTVALQAGTLEDRVTSIITGPRGTNAIANAIRTDGPITDAIMDTLAARLQGPYATPLCGALAAYVAGHTRVLPISSDSVPAPSQMRTVGPTTPDCMLGRGPPLWHHGTIPPQYPPYN